MSTFNKKMYLPITLDYYDLTLDMWNNIKQKVMDTYLYKESSGIMAIKITVCDNKELPLGEIINNQVLIQVPCDVIYKYYKMGDIVSGILTITDESDVKVLCGDLTCVLATGSGTISFSDSMYCFVRNGTIYPNGSKVTAILKEARPGTNSNFIFLATLLDNVSDTDS
ncbi:RNA polymerase [Sea otter poxvirus]|uniref:DNA-directed RNA polymerase 18 kDa subunit n=1 Tax=Sea otter poxvirus TaxID=1416741 RepID=A0A2U9QHQ3_9POXV|nr:RNA polymerase [Sea otter poxvirus]AWU47128.1 RNA polymerase [Sea otter poxvirus]